MARPPRSAGLAWRPTPARGAAGANGARPSHHAAVRRPPAAHLGARRLLARPLAGLPELRARVASCFQDGGLPQAVRPAAAAPPRNLYADPGPRDRAGGAPRHPVLPPHARPSALRRPAPARGARGGARGPPGRAVPRRAVRRG
ncbi:hypothetical protein QJS66_03040 [Kocuria rhizophila]|nr:hypothetical protein QJS66_03040 [Kocuria rhizophila]